MPAIIDTDGITKTIYSHDFDNGLKLMEHSWIGNEFVNAIYSCILDNPLRVAWIGDYSDEFDDLNPESYHLGMTLEDFKVYYDAVWGDKSTRIPKSSFSPADISLVDAKTKKHYLINRDLGIFLDMGKYIKRATVTKGNMKGWCINPLPLLTACGNNRGGGDFYPGRAKAGYEHVGIWAFHKLEYSKTKPVGFEEVEYTFIEQ